MECEADAIKSAMKADDRLYLCGIGKVNAAMVTQQAIDDGADEIINAGLAGGIDTSLKVGDVVGIAAGIEYDFDLDELNHRGIGVLDERKVAPIPFTGAKAEDKLILATGDHFRNDDGDFALLRSLGCSARDMEGAAIAHVCEKRAVKCRAIKAISNVAGQGGMVEQYEVCKARALAALSERLPNIL